MSEERHGAKSENGIPKVHVSELRLMSPSLEHEKRAFNAVKGQEYLAIALHLGDLQRINNEVWRDGRFEPIVITGESYHHNDDPIHVAPLVLESGSSQVDALKLIFGQQSSEEYRVKKVNSPKGKSVEIFSGQVQSSEGMQVLTIHMQPHGEFEGVSLRHNILGMHSVSLEDGSKVLAPLEFLKVASVSREKKNILFGLAHAATLNSYVRTYVPYRTVEGASVLKVPSILTTYSNEIVGTVNPHEHHNTRRRIFTDILDINSKALDGRREYHKNDATFYPNHKGQNLEYMFLRAIKYGENVVLTDVGFDLMVRLPHFFEEEALLQVAHQIDILNERNAR